MVIRSFALADQGLHRLNSILSYRRTELPDHLLDEWVLLDRYLSLALALCTLARSSLGRSFLLGADQFDLQSQGSSQVLIQRIVQPALLGRIEQRALPRVQMQQPIVTISGNQRTVCGDVACHTGDRQLWE